MAITAIQRDLTLTPSIVRIESSDTLATVAGANYILNQELVIDALNSGDFDWMVGDIVAVAASDGSEFFRFSGSNFSTLIQMPGGNGAVTLPVVANDFVNFDGTLGALKDLGFSASDATKTKVVMANGAVILNHIATYKDTAGTVGDDAAIAINGGSIQAGLDATAGTLISYPATTVSGHLILAAVNNSSGNFNTTISNAAAVGQSQVISIPDCGATTANLILSKNAGIQHITAGSLEVDAGSLISGIGTGGFVGLVKAFSTTATSGFIALQGAVNASGDFGTTLSNQTTQAQAQVLSFPDVGATTGNILAAGAPLVSGNFPKASGTSGAVVDSGITALSVSDAITQLGKLYQVSVTLNTAAVAAAYTTPQTIVANPLSSQMILVLQASVYTASTGHTAFATGTAPIIQYSSGGTNGAHGAGTIATAAGLADGDITAAASQVRNLFGFATGAQTGLSGLGLYFSNATGNYTAGTGSSITITIVYQLLTATV